MARNPGDKPPRVGVNDEDAFLGAPVQRPPGLDPFLGENDASIEGEVALEVLPQMARVTSSHYVVDKRSSSKLLVAAVIGVAVAAVAVYILFVR